jgi:hypothetical protein
MARLLAALDSNRFAEREQAVQELEKLGFGAEPGLRQALATKPSPEVRRRIDRLLENLQRAPMLQSLRALEILEHIGTVEAQQILESLAKGAPEARLTQEAKASLDRLRKLKRRPRPLRFSFLQTIVAESTAQKTPVEGVVTHRMWCGFHAPYCFLSASISVHA